MLYWSQQNIKTDTIKPTLVGGVSERKLENDIFQEFTSQTRRLGPRSFLHSGVLYKVKSNKLLVGMLYNDFLMLTTPVETIEQVNF